MRSRLGVDRLSGLYLLALMIVLFSILAPTTFPTLITVQIMATTSAVAAMVALALLIPMVAGQFDLSVGATANLGGIVTSTLLVDHDFSVAAAMVCGVGVGSLIGLVNGFVVVKLKVSSFIATLGMTSIAGAFMIIVTGNVEPIPTQSELFKSLTQTKVFGFQVILLYLVALAILLWWVLERTPVGRYMYAAGSNPEAARLTGIRVDMWSFLALVASGTISAFAGVLFVSLTGPSLSFGGSMLLPAFAAVFLGATQIHPGRMNVAGTLLAIVVLATGVQGLQLVTGVVWVASMFNGVALVAAVALAVGRDRRRTKVSDDAAVHVTEDVSPDASATEPHSIPEQASASAGR